jgi:hypothetical protein
LRHGFVTVFPVLLIVAARHEVISIHSSYLTSALLRRVSTLILSELLGRNLLVWVLIILRGILLLLQELLIEPVDVLLRHGVLCLFRVGAALS